LGTTNGELARRLLDRLSDLHELAVLHRADDLMEGSVVSDVDLVSRRPPAEIVLESERVFDELDIAPIMAWRYDSGDTLTVFFATRDGVDGLQFDFLRDPSGLGKYGVLSDELLDNSEPADRWQRIAAVDEHVYLLRKRHVKGQRERVRRLLGESERFEPEDVSEAIDRIFTVHAASTVRALVDGAEPGRDFSLDRLRSESARRIERIRHPTGTWVHHTSPAVANVAFERFQRYLPQTDLIPGSMGAWHLPRVAATRWRAGLVLSSGGLWGRPDVLIAGDTPEVALPDLVSSLSRRAMSLISDLAH
jgi:hypothetical protein